MFAGKFIPLAMLSCSAVALAADATTEQLKAQIDALQQKVEALEARQTSAADVDATVGRVLDDARRRSQLMQADNFTAGYNKGKFVLQSADGNYVFTPTAQFQGRYVGNYADQAADEEYNDGFELRRMKIGMAGNVVTKDLSYKFQWATDRNSGDLGLEDGWVRYKLSSDFSVFGGQFEDLTSHESLVSSSKQLAVDQSYANRVLIDSISEYTQGVGVTWSREKYRVSAAFTDGANSDNTNYQDQALNVAPAPGAAAEFSRIHYGTSARGEVMLLGDNWKAYDDFSAMGNNEDLLVLGSGIHRSEGDDGDLYLYSADLQWEPHAVQGLSLFGAFLGNHFDLSDSESSTNIGWLAQAGYMLTDRWEVFARYDQVNWDDDVFAANGDSSVQEYTVGLNYYISGHAAKLTADVVYLPDGTPRGESGLGIVSQDNDESQFVTRVQFQVLL